MRRWIRPLLKSTITCYLGIVIAVMGLERWLIFPAPRATKQEVDARPLGGEDVFFSSADGTQLHGWYFESPHANGQLLYCHGNGDMVPRLGEFAAGLRQLFGYSVFVFDYRGYGLSRGRPHEDGILQDARAARRWLAERSAVAESDIVLMGRSLGGGVAVDLAAKDGARGLILQSTFTSMPETAAQHLPWLPVRWLMRTRLESANKIKDYNGPVLQSHGTKDEVVPFVLGHRLFQTAKQPKRFFQIDGGRHNDPEPREYYVVLGEFLQSLGDGLQSPD